MWEDKRRVALDSGPTVPGRETGISLLAAQCPIRESVANGGFVSVEAARDVGDGADPPSETLLGDPGARDH
jgi:hypothetical protein